MSDTSNGHHLEPRRAACSCNPRRYSAERFGISDAQLAAIVRLVELQPCPPEDNDALVPPR